MENQYGYLSRYREDSSNELIEEEGYESFLNQMKIGVTKRQTFQRSITEKFLDTAPCLSYVYYPRNIRDFTFRQEGAPERLPVFGSKEGTSRVSRSLNFYVYYLCDPDKLTGMEFLHHVFGTNYITEAEATVLADPGKRLAEEGNRAPAEIRAADQLTVCRIVERLWTLLEKNPSNRIVFLLENARDRSMELLRQAYLLMPSRLRQEIGFWTNVMPSDLPVMFDEECLPVYLMTMERDVCPHTLSLKNLPLTVVDLETPDSTNTVFDSSRIAQLETLCSVMRGAALSVPVMNDPAMSGSVKSGPAMSEKTDLCMAYAETCVLRETGGIVSFSLYGEVLRRLWSEDLYWWKRTDLETVEQVYAAYTDQGSLMAFEPLRREAIAGFYLDLMPAHPYAAQINQILRDGGYPKRGELLGFLEQCLGYSAVLRANSDLVAQMDQEKLDEMRRTEEASLKHEEQSLEEQKQYLHAQQARAEERLCLEKEEEKKSALAELQRECDQKSEENRQAWEQQYEELKAIGEERYQKLAAESEEKYSRLEMESAEKYCRLETESAEKYRRLETESAEKYSRLETESGEKYRRLEAESAEKYLELERSSEESYQQLKDEKEQSYQALEQTYTDTLQHIQEYEKQLSDLQQQQTDNEKELAQLKSGAKYRQMKLELDEVAQNARDMQLSLEEKDRELEEQKQESEDKLRTRTKILGGMAALLLLICAGVCIMIFL